MTVPSLILLCTKTIARSGNFIEKDALPAHVAADCAEMYHFVAEGKPLVNCFGSHPPPRQSWLPFSTAFNVGAGAARMFGGPSYGIAPGDGTYWNGRAFVHKIYPRTLYGVTTGKADKSPFPW